MSKLIKDFNIGFTQIPNQIIRDDRLSWKAKGIYMHLVSKPPVWSFYVEEIIKSSKDGKTAVQSGIKELEVYGYLKRVKAKSDDGKFTGWDYLLRIEADK